MKKISILLATVVISGLAGLVSCSNSTSSSDEECSTEECINQARKSVIAVHDEVMPKLSQISKLKEEIEARIENLSDTTEMESWRNLMIELDVADESMWVWMRQFDSSLDDKSPEEAIEYLKEEQAKVDEVARKINESIANAEARLRD